MTGARADLERHDGVAYALIDKELPRNLNYLINFSVGEGNRLIVYDAGGNSYEFPVLAEYFDQILRRYDDRTRQVYSGLEKRFSKDPKEVVEQVYSKAISVFGVDTPDIVGFDGNLELKVLGESLLWSGKGRKQKNINVMKKALVLEVPFYLAVPIKPMNSREGWLLKKLKQEVQNSSPGAIANLVLFSYETTLFGNDPKFCKEEVN